MAARLAPGATTDPVNAQNVWNEIDGVLLTVSKGEQWQCYAASSITQETSLFFFAFVSLD
jgi:hypothetical protein